MKGKNIIILGIGATGGFIGGSVFIINKMLHSERMKNAFVDIVANKIQKILFGEESYRPRYNLKISYRSYYASRKNSYYPYHYFEDVAFETRSDAEAALDAMKDIINNYGYLSIADYYDLCRFSNTDYTTNCYGWTNIKDALVVRCKGGYKLKLPKAMKIK